MVVTERDKLCAKTLLEVLTKAKYDLTGPEVIGVFKIMQWSTELLNRIENDLKPQQTLQQLPDTAIQLQELPKKTKKAKND